MAWHPHAVVGLPEETALQQEQPPELTFKRGLPDSSPWLSSAEGSMPCSVSCSEAGAGIPPQQPSGGFLIQQAAPTQEGHWKSLPAAAEAFKAVGLTGSALPGIGVHVEDSSSSSEPQKLELLPHPQSPLPTERGKLHQQLQAQPDKGGILRRRRKEPKPKGPPSPPFLVYKAPKGWREWCIIGLLISVAAPSSVILFLVSWGISAERPELYFEGTSTD